MGNTTDLPSYPPSSLKKHFKSLERHKDPILVFDSNQEIIFANRLSLKLFKSKKNKLFHSSLYQISTDFQPHQQKETPQAIVQEINGFGNEGPKSFQWYFKTSQSKEFMCSIYLNLFRSDGKLLCTAFLRNIQSNKVTKNTNKNSNENRRLDQKTLESNESLMDLLSIPKKTTNINSNSNQNKVKKSASSPSLKIVKTSFNTTTNNSMQKKRVARNTTKEEKHHLLSFDDYDTKMTDILEGIKTIIRDSDDFSLENEVTQDLNEIYKVFKSAIVYRDSRVTKLNETIVEDRKTHKKKYQELESHLQRRLVGLKGEQELKESLQAENDFFQKNFNEMKRLMRIQQKALKKMKKISKKTKDFKNNIYQASSSSEDSSDNSLSSDLDSSSEKKKKKPKKKNENEEPKKKIENKSPNIKNKTKLYQTNNVTTSENESTDEKETEREKEKEKENKNDNNNGAQNENGKEKSPINKKRTTKSNLKKIKKNQNKIKNKPRTKSKEKEFSKGKKKSKHNNKKTKKRVTKKKNNTKKSQTKNN
ncbi:hypothetical protein M0813_13425 [Anaeramoeba flamelloides]|uniref:Uncharacterized protein n=1 Tax=Anaeramoeba flamelloides TaxID=1746091 RepID=A0ABQ8Z9V2_9EUKA|nr:hypothetical protein M0813_13425 [Anaeramoeba flamelloides]